jgi:chromosomal replication initiator protein
MRFVVVPENRTAWLTVRHLARQLRHQRRPRLPIVLHGPAGIGKTHLLNRLVRSLSHLTPARTALLVPASDCNALPFDDPSAVNQLLRDWHQADLFALEGLHHLDARRAEIVIGLLDARLVRGQACIITAERGPSAWTHLPERLVSRLAGGLVVGLEPLGPASRAKLLRAWANQLSLPLTPAALTWLSAQTDLSPRGLRGQVQRLSGLKRARLDVTDVQAALCEPDAAPDPVARVLRSVGRYFGVDPTSLGGASRQPQVRWPRQVGMYLLRQLTRLSLVQIGAAFGGRDHSTVLHACKVVTATTASNPQAANDVRRLQAELA